MCLKLARWRMSELSTRIVDLPCAYERVFKNMWVGFHFSRLKELTMPERIISYALLEDLLSCASIFAGSSSRDLRNYGRQMRKPRGPVGSPCGFPTGIPPDLTHPWGSRGSVQDPWIELVPPCIELLPVPRLSGRRQHGSGTCIGVLTVARA